MAWSTPDITSITDVLHDGLDAAIQAAIGGAFTITVSRSSPETTRKNPCQLSFYLMHVGRDAYWRNTPVDGPRPQLNTAQPLSLNLYYLLTAWADTRYDQEQRAMTVALQYFHSNPIYRHLSGGAVDEEFTISVEADTIEEMSRLWQAITVPMRLSCVVKVGVVFVSPAETPPAPAASPVTANVAVGPWPGQGDPVALYGAMNLAFAPFPTPIDPSQETVAGGELVAVASGVGGNSNIVVRGTSLDQPDAAQVFLSTPDGASEWPLGAAWRQPTADPGLLELFLPDSYLAAVPASGAVLDAVPPPGVYRLAVGRNDPAGNARSNRIPLVIAARVDAMTGPAAGPFTVSGDGFAPGSIAISLGGVDVTASATIGATTISFPAPPFPPPPGPRALALSVNGVPTPPGPVVTL